MAHCYILFSKKLNGFYIGSSLLSPADRLDRHLHKYYGERKYTSKASDWVIYYIINCDSLDQARKIEKHIKSMKSKKYIQNLKVYPEIADGLLAKYSTTPN